MAVTEATLRHLRQLTIQINSRVDQTTRDLARAWSRAWQEVSGEMRAAVDELIELGDGEWPTRSQVLRAQRATNAMKIVSDALDDLGKQAGMTIAKGLPLIVDETDRLTALIVDSQLPQRNLQVSWQRADRRQLEAIVKRSTEQITSLTRPLSQRSAAVMRSVLVRGVAVGENPRVAARRMMQRTEQAFTGGRYRAENIATTEMIDAHRAAALEQRKANPDVLAGWRWSAKFDSRTCGSCLAMDGEEFPADVFGPDDHQRGRCTALPITKTWRDLGFDLDEPAPVPRQSGREWWEQQPRKVQDRTMGGAERAERLRDGRLSWDQVSVRQDNPGWRPSRHLAPLAP